MCQYGRYCGSVNFYCCSFKFFCHILLSNKICFANFVICLQYNHCWSFEWWNFCIFFLCLSVPIDWRIYYASWYYIPQTISNFCIRNSLPCTHKFRNIISVQTNKTNNRIFIKIIFLLLQSTTLKTFSDHAKQTWFSIGDVSSSCTRFRLSFPFELCAQLHSYLRLFFCIFPFRFDDLHSSARHSLLPNVYLTTLTTSHKPGFTSSKPRLPHNWRRKTSRDHITTILF